MQQPLPQHDQLAAQQLQQQMLLCPVRVVYETQILVQPGDQIQPNQTLFINPQNPPPWAQRPVQNQVIYVQQMPGNIVPSLPQHMDQNQLYLHQYPGYQQGVQMIPQQMVQNMQENRQNTIQMPNLIHQNMLQNFQTNMPSSVGQNLQMAPDRTTQQANYGQIHQNIGANMQIQQSQINLASNNNRSNDTIANVQNQVQQTQYAQKDAKQAYIGQMGQVNVSRPQPQVLTANAIQNQPQTTNIQTFAPNIVRPIKTESVGSQITPPTYVNAGQNTQITRIRKVAPTTNVSKINPTIGIRTVSQTQTYRPIQPRPLQQFRAPLPNYSTIEPISQANSMPLLNQNIININSLPIQNVNATNFRPEDLNSNRKRKSESPDEIHKKMAAIQMNITPIKQISDVTKRSEAGVNTSPSQNNQVTITPSILQPNNVKIDVKPPTYSNMQGIDAKNISYIIQNVHQNTAKDHVNIVKPNLETIEAPNNSTPLKENTILDKDKLVRNTVFTQARGRVLTDKEALELTESTIPPSVNILKEITITPKKAHIEANNEIKAEISNKSHMAAESVKTETKNDAEVEIKMKTSEVKTEQVEIESKVIEIKEEKREMEDMNVSLNTTNNKGMFPMERAVKQEKDYILTHVLDGIVIQESNVAFPIREPLIKRITQTTAQTNNDVKKVEKDAKSIEGVPPARKDVKSNEDASEISQNTENKADEETTQGDNPFQNVSATTVKSWTTHELSSHLSRLGWEDTASLFVEHEIDGESLYLVSKTQLQTIGVKEEQADVICAFVKS